MLKSVRKCIDGRCNILFSVSTFVLAQPGRAHLLHLPTMTRTETARRSFYYHGKTDFFIDTVNAPKFEYITMIVRLIFVVLSYIFVVIFVYSP